MTDLRVEAVRGDAVLPWLEDLARLRIAIFRDFPYLYDGDMAYERHYLRGYAAAATSVFVLATDHDKVVGVSTGLMLSDAEPDFQQPFQAAAWAEHRVFYFGESVLDPAYRGRGLGHAFFDAREQHARELGATVTTFCAVERPADHPRRPADHRALDTFWQHRGYVRRPELQTTFTWKDLDDTTPTAKPMVFWTRNLP